MTPLRREWLIWGLVIAVALTLFIVYRLERPEHITPISVFVIIESTVTVMGIVYALFIGFAWHYRFFKGWLVRVPDVRGTWKGSILPLDASGTSLASVPCQLVIRQKLFSISCVLHTRGARSQSFAGNAFVDEDSGEERLVYAYRGIPRLADRRTNPSHEGTAVLVLKERDRLAGTYFTDRCTRGEIALILVSRKTNIPFAPDNEGFDRDVPRSAS